MVNFSPCPARLPDSNVTITLFSDSNYWKTVAAKLQIFESSKNAKEIRHLLNFIIVQDKDGLFVRLL